MLSHRKASEGDAIRLLSGGSGEGKKVGKGRGISVGFIGWLQQTPHYPAQEHVPGHCNSHICLSPVLWGMGNNLTWGSLGSAGLEEKGRGCVCILEQDPTVRPASTNDRHQPQEEPG